MISRMRDVLREEADSALTRAEDAEAKSKGLEQTILEQEHEIASLRVQLSNIDEALGRAEDTVSDAKAATRKADESRSTIASLTRKIAPLEEELNTAERHAKDTVESCATTYTTELLREVDMKAEHFERQVRPEEQECDMWERKYEDAQAKATESKAELDELVATMEGL
ncbi:tropomyosin [Mycena rebaudengoi]|nr:tropomyosin [Mycena rebaudengoi]